MDLTVEAAVVVRDRVKGEVLDEAVEPDRHPRSPIEVLLVHGLRQLEDVARQLLACGDLTVTDLLDASAQIIELEHLHVPAELRGDEGHVGGDIEHARIQVPHESMACVPQYLPYFRRVDPLLDPAPGLLVMEVAGNRSEVDTTAAEDVCHLWQRALPAVGEPLASVEGGVVHVLGWLHVDHQDGRVAALGDRKHHVGRQVRRQVDDDHVAVSRSQPLRCRRTLRRIRDESHVDDFAVHPSEPLGHEPCGSLQLLEETRELRPVGAEASSDQADAHGPVLLVLEDRCSQIGRRHAYPSTSCGGLYAIGSSGPKATSQCLGLHRRPYLG